MNVIKYPSSVLLESEAALLAGYALFFFVLHMCFLFLQIN